MRKKNPSRYPGKKNTKNPQKNVSSSQWKGNHGNQNHRRKKGTTQNGKKYHGSNRQQEKKGRPASPGKKFATRGMGNGDEKAKPMDQETVFRQREGTKSQASSPRKRPFKKRSTTHNTKD